jgi:hypothetical protein
MMENQQTQTWLEKATPFIAILSLQLGYAVMDVLSKAALNNGMSNYVFVVYRHAVAFIVITPFALYFEKYNPLSPPPLSLYIYLQFRARLIKSLFMKRKIYLTFKI